MLVSPELSSGADTSLNLVNKHVNSQLKCQISHTLGEFSRQIVVATFGLDRLHCNADHLLAFLDSPLLNLGTHVSKSCLVLSPVILNILCQRILVSRVDRSWPVEGGDIDLMHILGSGGGQRAKKSTVEALLQ